MARYGGVEPHARGEAGGQPQGARDGVRVGGQPRASLGFRLGAGAELGYV
jgi:hypothetical protein